MLPAVLRPPLRSVRSAWGRVVCAAVLAAVVRPAPAVAIIPADGYYSFQYATGLGSLTSMTFGPDGTLYVAELGGRIKALRDTDGDRFADTITTFKGGLATPLGTAWRSGGLFVSVQGKILKLTDGNGDFVADVVDTVVANIPVGLHRNNGIAFGPEDGLLYVTNGSQTETEAGHPWSAAILRFTESGAFVDVFADGMRNPYDLAFYVPRNKLFSSDNAVSGDPVFPCYDGPDELNQIVEDASYGFPDCFGAGNCADAGCDPPPCGTGSCARGAGCSGTTTPALLLEPHSAPTGICFGQGFNGFDSRDLFLAQFGTFPAEPCVSDFGHQVIHLRLNPAGNLGSAQPDVFISDLHRPTDIAVGPDSALYVCDFDLGTVFRVIQVQQTGAGDARAPHPARLWASPNPAASHTQFYWEDAPAGEIRYAVFDLAGRRVAEFAAPDGRPRAWRLRDDAGRRVPDGLYVVRASGGGRSASAKVMVRE